MKDDYLDINKKTYNKSAGFAEENMKKNPSTYEDVIEHLNKYLDGHKEILELGPGNGYALKLLSEKGHKVAGLEFSTERAKLARKTAPKANLLVGEFLAYDFESNRYEVIIAMEFIHLFPPGQFEEVMAKIFNLLEKDGLAVFSTTINETSNEGYLKRVDELVRYRRKFTKDELEKILKNYNFETLDYFETQRLSGDALMNFICRK